MVSIKTRYAVRALGPFECSQDESNNFETLKRLIDYPVSRTENGVEVCSIVTQREQFEVSCLLLCTLPNCLKIVHSKTSDFFTDALELPPLVSKPKLIHHTEALVDIIGRNIPKCVLLVASEYSSWNGDAVIVKYVQPSDVLGENSTTLKDRKSILAVLEKLDIRHDDSVIVASESVQRVAVIAVAILSVEFQNVSLCIFDPRGGTTKWANDLQAVPLELQDNSFDVPALTSSVEIQKSRKGASRETIQAYEAFLDSAPAGKCETKDWVKINLDGPSTSGDLPTKKSFFGMPSALSRDQFLQITNNILCYASFVLAPLGFPNFIRRRYTCAEFLSQTQVLVQDILEVCSDVAYEEFGVDETLMALSLHKWTEEVRDSECIEQIKTIGQLAQSLFELPRAVEIPLHLTSQRTSAILEKLLLELESRIDAACPWTLHSHFATNVQDTDLYAESLNKDMENDWKCMYAGVAYSLLYVPHQKFQTWNKLSNLQQRTLIQVVAESVRSIFETEVNISMVQVQALIEATPGMDEEAATWTKQIKYSFYAMMHTLSSSLESGEVDSERRERSASYVEQGDRFFRSGCYDEAISFYSKALLELPIFHALSWKAIVGKAKCYAKKGDTSVAQQLCKISLQLDQFQNEAYECLAEMFEEESDDFIEALQNYVVAFVLHGSRSLEVANSIDRVAKEIGRQTAKSFFDEMQKDHRLPASWLVVSYFEAFVHDIDHAITIHSDISKHLDVPLDALSTDTLYHRAIFHKRNQMYDKAQSDLQALLERNLADDIKATVLNLHSSFLYILGDVTAAIEKIDQSLEINVCVNSLVKKAGFMTELGDFEEAYKLYDEALILDCRSPDAYLHKGQTALLQGSYSKAVEWLRRTMARSVAIPIIHVIYATALYRSGSILQANDTFREACVLFPDSAEIHLFYGEILADQGDYAKAMQHFVLAHDILPECPLPFLNAGRVYVATNNPSSAIEHFNQALKVDPRCSSAHLDIAQVLFAQGRTSEAFRHFDAAANCCRFLPEVEEVYSSRAVANAQLKATEILGVDLRHLMRQK
uniref:Mitochondrial Protein Translocase (MPT) Family puta n=1 Tax=Albugo laibachii Nc14 TaxID=890382 RepID=F0WGA5_9STRA|nr:Mitochondrial Protein Translocase (MPT) Family puta [Albugo laibachii Nc14]|eukprot:CCA20240.1 Mitochondrial Protein Translocase (MPT) Family puta [Albugo laibachii Nc14]